MSSEVPNGNEERTRGLAMPGVQMKFDLLQRDKSGSWVVTTLEFKENECENGKCVSKDFPETCRVSLHL